LQVFVNLLSNARDASEDGERVTIRASTSEGQALVTVEDRGCGIATELQEQVFEPFFTTKDPGQGTGLGLALVYSIMDDMHGSVQLTSPVQEGPYPGTRVTLKLPTGDYGATFDV
jgi:signal transduction histidine kinase